MNSRQFGYLVMVSCALLSGCGKGASKATSSSTSNALVATPPAASGDLSMVSINKSCSNPIPLMDPKLKKPAGPLQYHDGTDGEIRLRQMNLYVYNWREKTAFYAETHYNHLNGDQHTEIKQYLQCADVANEVMSGSQVYPAIISLKDGSFNYMRHAIYFVQKNHFANGSAAVVDLTSGVMADSENSRPQVGSPTTGENEFVDRDVQLDAATKVSTRVYQRNATEFEVREMLTSTAPENETVLISQAIYQTVPAGGLPKKKTATTPKAPVVVNPPAVNQPAKADLLSSQETQAE